MRANGSTEQIPGGVQVTVTTTIAAHRASDAAAFSGAVEKSYTPCAQNVAAGKERIELDCRAAVA